MTEPEHIVPVGPVRPTRRSSPFVRVGIVTGTAALVLVGAVAAMGASPAPSDSTTTPLSPAASGDPNGDGKGPGRWGGFGDLGAIGGIGRGFGAITITAIDGSKLDLKTDDGWTRTITVTSATTVTKAGATIALGDLAVGDEIHFAQAKATDGTYSITRIVVVVPSLSGEVTAKTANSITVTRRDGSTATIHVDSATTYTVRGVDNATLADIAVGMRIRAEGAQRSDGSLDASNVVAGNRFGPGHDDGSKNGTTPNASPNASSTPG
jgi:Domain of unknown function (DUF5666)